MVVKQILKSLNNVALSLFSKTYNIWIVVSRMSYGDLTLKNKYITWIQLQKYLLSINFLVCYENSYHNVLEA